MPGPAVETLDAIWAGGPAHRRIQESSADALGSYRYDLAEELVEREPTLQALSRLPDAERAAIFMVDWLGCSIREVAQAEGIAYDAFYRRLQHGRRSLRSLLELAPRAEKGDP